MDGFKSVFQMLHTSQCIFRVMQSSQALCAHFGSLPLVNNPMILLSLSQFGLSAVVNAWENQWIDLGDLSQYSCIVKPSTCGTNGGSLSVWIKTGNCDEHSGILTSMRKNFRGGLAIFKNQPEDNKLM